MRKAKVYGYARISTPKQVIGRQIDNIKSKYPEAVIIEEAYTGTTLDRPKWAKLEKSLKAGDTVVFDEVSRMSRNAEEGFEVYKDLYSRGVNLVFLKEGMLNTEVFKQTEQIALTGNEIADVYIEATNKVLMILAENQIKAAFETAQHEVDFLHKRTSEGVRRAQAAGKQVGRKTGANITTKKSIAVKAKIREYSAEFNGTLKDVDVIKLVGVTRNTYYKYKAELRLEDLEAQGLELQLPESEG